MTSFLVSIFLGKAPYGDELHVSIWFGRILVKIIMEIRPFRYSFTNTGINLKLI